MAFLGLSIGNLVVKVELVFGLVLEVIYRISSQWHLRLVLITWGFEMFLPLSLADKTAGGSWRPRQTAEQTMRQIILLGPFI